MIEPLIIQMYPRESECIVCHVDLVNPRQGVPMYEGEVLPNDHEGEWAGFDACERCVAWQACLTKPMHVTAFLRWAESLKVIHD